jgi:hypothetical protein
LSHPLFVMRHAITVLRIYFCTPYRKRILLLWNSENTKWNNYYPVQQHKTYCIMKPKTQIIITIIAIVSVLFVWWITIQEKTTLLGDPNQRDTDSAKVIYSKESTP